ncbi:choline/carnitine O-acyltransferase [Uruburuella testudinis]|uniref:Choline/carnitine O-acyltransferase n=1 Tax=Uruburuella testudinis TaxID=1282863 RepID=A0ABY4DSY4_9NEIS|nr:choline/carnitine O-acyltransferase [Uruburuella testudinis]UOO81809.1 choline/carnitine O-acyltransferase [Uruburuella testudinis]
MMNSTPLLPVPPLAETAERYLQWVRPLLDDAEFAHTQALTTQFVAHEGAQLQQDLLRFAAEKQNSSWLIDAWLQSYLAGREPLPLVSNVGFAVEHQGRLKGVEGLARWVAAAAAVHADYLHGRIEAAQTPQGQPVCLRQWRVLQGAVRVAAPDCDRYEFAAAAAEGRCIGVFWHGYYYRLPALDGQGRPYAAEAFQTALLQIIADTAENPYPVATPALLGSKRGAPVCHALAQVSQNAELLAQMREDLFHISLQDMPGLSEDEELHAATFNSGGWVYKPLGYRYNLAGGHLAVHCEHTWPDGGMIKGMVARILQQLANPAGVAVAELAPSRKEWVLTAAQQQAWPQWQAQYADQAAAMRVSSCEISWPQPAQKGISQDALIQFALQYAQLRTWGRVRNTYEAVDVSHFQSGRTECIRPLSMASLCLVQALAEGAADKAVLQAALVEHKNRVKACKTGHGVNRHLLGLKLMAQQRGSVPAWFDDKAYGLLCEDFLSTSTLGDGEIIRNFAFAPTSPGGLGINYTMLPQSWLLTVSYTDGQAEAVENFQTAFTEGARKLWALAFD